MKTSLGDSTDVPSHRPGSPNISEINRLFDIQSTNRQCLRDTTAADRIARLKSLRAALFERREALYAALSSDFHKAPEEVDLTEVSPVAVEIKHTIENLASWMKPKRVGTPLILLGTSSEIRYEPRGTALIIAPWNYPVNLTLGPLVGAVAAGCPAIIKPSELTPHTTAFIQHLLAVVFPENEVAVVPGDYRVAKELLKHPFDHIYFTGSPAVGKEVMRAAAEHLSSVTLELGGKSPTVVDASADVKDAAMKIAFGKFANKGQTCIAPDHVYVHESLHQQFIDCLTDQIRKFYGAGVGDREASPDYARIVTEGHYHRVTDLYVDAVSRGATAVTGATGDAGERFIDPTILTDLPPDARIMHEEVFGPVLPVVKFSSLDEVVSRINSGPRPLALYIFSSNRKSIEHLLAHTTAGGTCVNDTLLHYLHPELPFGGIGNSGMGQAHGYHNFMAFTNSRPVLRQRLKHAPFKHLYPPYTRTTRRLIDIMFKLLRV